MAEIDFLKTFYDENLNFVQAWRERQDRRDQAEWAAGVQSMMAEAEPAAKAEGGKGSDTGGGSEVQAPDPQQVLAEKPVKKATDELAQYREMRASEGPEGGVYDATKLGRSGWKDEVARDPIAALTKLINEVTRFSSPDVSGGTPGTPGDVKGMASALKTATSALKRITGGGQAAGAAVSAAGQAMKGEVATTNVARVDASQSVQATMKRLNTLLGKPRDPAIATHADTIAGAENALSLEEALKTPDAAWSLEDMRFKQQKLRDLHAGLATEVDRLVKATKAGDATASDALMDTFLLAGVIGNKDRAVGTGAGRLLEARKILADAERSGLATRDLEGLVERLGLEGATDLEQIARVKAQMIAEGIDGTTIANMLNAAPKGQRKQVMQGVWNGYKVTTDALHWVWLQNLLSNPVSHAANILGTTATTLAHYPERYVAEWINRVFRHDAAGVQRGETWQMMRASGRAAVDGFRLLGRAIAKGEQPLGRSNVEAHFDLRASQFGWDESTALGKFVDTVGMVTPTRLMMAEDGFFKGFNKTQEIAALALREGLARAKEGESLAETAARVKALEAKPTTTMIQAAEVAAHLRTLNAELGPAGKAMMTARNLTPGAWAVMPFFQTPTNSIKWAWQRTPLLSLTSIQNMQDIAAGGAARDLAISRVLLGHAIGGAIAYQVIQGNITGASPVGSNKDLKRDATSLGVRPFTIRVGEEMYGYKRTDPIGQYIGTIATGIEIYSQLHRDDQHDFDYGDFVLASGLAASRVALDTPWLQGLGNVFHAIEHPDTDGKKVARGFAQSLVPAGIRQGTRTGFLGLTEPRPEVRELETLLDAVRAGLPAGTPVIGGVDLVPPYLHPITGDTVEYPPGWGPDLLSPIFVSQRKDDPVLLQILQHGMDFKEPSKMLFGSEERALTALDPTRQPDGVKLSKGQYFRLKQLATTEVRDAQGRTMHDAMAAEIRGEGYQRDSGGPDAGKERRLKIIYNDFYERARGELQKDYPSLRLQLDEARSRKIRRGLPESSPDALPAKQPGVPEVLKSLIPSLGR